MVAPTTKMSTSYWIRFLLYVMTRVLREKATEHLATGLQSTVDALDAVGLAAEGKLRALSRARAASDAADMDIDREITAFESALLVLVGKDRRSGPYRKIFPNGLTAVTRTRSSIQLRQVRTIEDAIRREFPEAAWAQEALTKITAAREEYERQGAALRRAEEDVAGARAAERAARVDATRQLRYTYAELLKIHAHSPRQAGSFFPRANRSEKAGPSEDVVPVPVTDAPAPTP